MTSVCMRILIIIAGLFVAPLLMGDDWTTFGHDQQHSGASLDSVLSPSLAPQLTMRWQAQTGGTVYTSATVASGIAYFGSWDGYEYAVSVANGSLVWKQFVGITTNNCYGSIGVSSTAAVQNGVVYLGGGDDYWYALNATTGSILWKTYVGDNTKGNYNWASPLIYNGDAYIGVASLCDVPLVSGGLLQVDLTTHQVVNRFAAVSNTHTGGSIWSTPAVDRATNTVYVTTGNEDVEPSVDPYPEAMVALDASTLQVKGSWQVPPSELVYDSDFGGSSPILFTDSSGERLVGAVNKNGYLYAFERDNLSAGPLWERPVASGGEGEPAQGDGSVSSGAFANGTLFMAGGNTSINGATYQGGVRALDPATGGIIWEHGVPGIVLADVVYDNGLLIDDFGSFMEVLDAATGNRLYRWQGTKQMYGLSVAEGRIFAASADHNLYAFGLPVVAPSPTPTPVPDASCPASMTCQDIGNPSPPGSDTTTPSSVSVSAGGNGVKGNSDQFRFLFTPTAGDSQVAAAVSSLSTQNANAQAGLMDRESADPTSPFYAVFLTPFHGLTVMYRATRGSGVVTLPIQPNLLRAPRYLEIQRKADRFIAAVSTDGVNYTLIPGSHATLVLPGSILTGLAVSSNNTSRTSTAVFAGTSIGLPGAVPATPPSPTDSGCPSGWSCRDIGSFYPAGTESSNGTGWTVQGAGVGFGGLWQTPQIGTNSDELHFMWQPISGDMTVATEITAQTNSNPWAEAGIMVRDSSDPGAMYYAVYSTPGQGIVIASRSATGSFNRTAIAHVTSFPIHLGIRRTANNFAAATSTDGTHWTRIPGSSQTIPLSTTSLVGLAVTSTSPGTLGTATFGPVTFSFNAASPVWTPAEAVQSRRGADRGLSR